MNASDPHANSRTAVPASGVESTTRRRFLKGAIATAACAGLAAAPAASPFRIARARIHHFEAKAETPVVAAFGAMTSRHLVLLEIEDEDGRRGFGESWTNFPSWAAVERLAAFRGAFIPYLAGREVADVPAFMDAMGRAFRGPALQSGTMGPLVSSLCAVAQASYDLAAKRRGVPLARLLFPQPAARVQIYGSGLNAPFPWKQIERFLGDGVSHFKMKLGFGDEIDLKSIAELKGVLGAKAKLAVDVNRNWTFAHAKTWLGRLADYDVQWLEEPLRVEEVGRTAELAALSKVPVAGGENYLVAPGSDLGRFAEEPLAIIQPDVAKYCMAHDFLRLLPEAAKRGKRVVPHFLAAAPGQIFSAHLAAGCGPQPLVEWDANVNPLLSDFFTEPVKIRGGMLELPERPGLGWTPALDSKYRVG